jgi:hypothetical protein
MLATLQSLEDNRCVLVGRGRYDDRINVGAFADFAKIRRY